MDVHPIRYTTNEDAQMNVLDLRNLLANMPDDADIMVIDKEDSCTHFTGHTVNGRDGTCYLEVSDLFETA